MSLIDMRHIVDYLQLQMFYRVIEAALLGKS